MTVPMSVVEDIRLLDSQGVPWRQIATRLGVSRDSVAKYAQMEDLSAVPVRRAPTRGGGVLSGHEAFIDQVLEADKSLSSCLCMGLGFLVQVGVDAVGVGDRELG